MSARLKGYTEVGEMWSRQTSKSVVFPKAGAIPHSCLMWRKPDGSAVWWHQGREGDTLLALSRFVKA